MVIGCLLAQCAGLLPCNESNEQNLDRERLMSYSADAIKHENDNGYLLQEFNHLVFQFF